MRRPTFALLLALSPVACTRTPLPPNDAGGGATTATTTAAPTSASAAPQTGLPKLRYASEEIEARLSSVDRCVEDLAAAAHFAQRIPVRVVGFDSQAAWCTGQGARDGCVIAEMSEHQRDQHAIELETLLEPDKTCYGFGLRVLRVPVREGWGVKLAWADDEPGAPPSTSGYELAFRRYGAPPSTEPTLVVELGHTMRYPVRDARGDAMASFEVVSDAEPRAELATFARSSEAMRDAGVKRLAELEKKVVDAVDAHAVKKCLYGPSRRGLPPECTRVALTPEEETTAIAAARDELGKRAAALKSDHAAMHGALLAAYPLDRCWP